MKNIFHAEMALLVRRQKEIEEKLRDLSRDFETWKGRVELARNTDRGELATRAEQRLDEVRTEASLLRSELKRIETMKKKVRYESRRPSGQEVQRARALLESFRQSGLVDPDEAYLESAFDNLAAGRPAGDGAPESVDENNGEIRSEQVESKASGGPKKLDDLDLDDLENLDLDELEALVGGQD